MTVLERLRVLFPRSSGRTLRHWIEGERVRVNGRAVTDARLTVGRWDVVTLGPRLRPAATRPPFPAPIRVVHEDDTLIVIDKPPGLLTIATDRERVRNAYRMLWDYLATGPTPRRPFIVHRLDRDTSGLLVLAKSAEAKQHLQAQFEARTVERIYVAVVEGRMRADSGTLRSRLTEDRSLRVRETRGPRGRGHAGKEAITHYRVLERRANTTLLELALGTGRRQQIRVQLAALGHPIVGDSRSRPGDSPGGSRHDAGGKRLLLHAMRLGFAHPATGAPVRFETLPPEAFGPLSPERAPAPARI